jgi:predicted adenylyl cyclase CyaB
VATNVEIKARAGGLAALAEEALSAGATEAGVFRQEDSFFRCASGRLKLRVVEGAGAELIAYQRPDEAGPKLSRYEVVPVADPVRMKAALSSACGVLGVVRKRRTLFLLGRTRIHLDEVEGLGDFVELEFVRERGESNEVGRRAIQTLMKKLGIRDEDLVKGAYLDALLRGKASLTRG